MVFVNLADRIEVKNMKKISVKIFVESFALYTYIKYMIR